MKKLYFLICILIASRLYSQDSLTIFISANQQVSDVLTPKKIYKYPEFLPGTVIFKDGSTATSMFNYNYLNGEVEFIQNDTLAIGKQQLLNIKIVLLDKDSFFYNKGYLQQVIQTPAGKLLKKQMLLVTKREKIGAYDQPSSTSAIESYGSFTDVYGSFTPNLKIRENIILSLRTDYYFGDKFNNFLLASRKNVFKLYPNKDKQIQEYLRKHAVNFRNEKELKNLLNSLQ